MRFRPFDQRRYPLATLVLVATERPIEQRLRLLTLAARESSKRAETHGIPVFF